MKEQFVRFPLRKGNRDIFYLEFRNASDMALRKSLLGKTWILREILNEACT